MNRFRAGATLAAAALLMALAGCTSGPGVTSDASESPLNKYMMALYSGDLSEAEQIAKSERDNREREELVAQCMAEEGFDYLPAIDDGSMMISSGEEWKPDDRAWVAQYGYGMIDWPGRVTSSVENTETAPIDPNEDYVESLSESERNAYHEALRGPSRFDDSMSDDGVYEWNWETAGCSGWAQHEMEGKNPATSEAHKPIMDTIKEFSTSMQTSAEFTEIDAAWSGCMADAGRSGFASQTEAQTLISDELNTYYESLTEFVDNDPVLEELAEKEITLALVDLDCRQKLDYAKKRLAITYELEEKFIADHKAELDALKADAEQQR